MADTHNAIILDDTLLTKAEETFGSIGVDINTAIHNFVENVVQRRISPSLLKFMVTTDETDDTVDYEDFFAPVPTPYRCTDEQKKRRASLSGFLTGKIWMSDDFDAPLECMKDYM